ncbi:MAG: hypothetical protein N4A72_00875 [Bacteroidales bacterium]|jgi:hypothetical protein|nr:hypothetical protein [Bacteroidales bacterium]
MKNKQYFNEAQQNIMYTGAHTTVVVGGRRFGKTHGVRAPWLQRNFQYMPRSAGGIVGTSLQQIKTRTLPGTLQALEQFGFKRDVHYYVGHKPPRSAGFQKPHIKPISYDNVLSWYNGSIWYMISQDIKGSSNSLTLDYIDIDEAKFVDYEKLKDETIPANGGFKGHFSHCPYHHSMLICSDMPTTKKGSWFLDYREKMKIELLQAIHSLLVEKYNIEKEGKVTAYKKRRYREIQLHLAKLRSITVYYKEVSTIENIQLLGEKYIKQMKRDLPPLIFQTSILCKRVTRLKDGFYPSLRESIHYYTAFNNSYLSDLGYDFEKLKVGNMGCRQDGDINPKKPLLIAFDYNANINWLVVGQVDGMKIKILKSFFVKYERKLRELVDDFCNYYRFHPTKEVVYYYDSTAIGSNYAVSDEDFASVICNQFYKNKWRIAKVYMGNPEKHRQKHLMLDQSLKGQKYLIPQINKANNEALILALEQAGVKIGRNGFEKDKSREKLAETEEDKLEHRTDGTDAFDTLLLGAFLFGWNHGSGIISPTGWVG